MPCQQVRTGVAVGQSVQQPAVAGGLVAHVPDQRTDDEIDQVAPDRVAHEIGKRQACAERAADEKTCDQKPPAESEREQRQRIASLFGAQRRMRIVGAAGFLTRIELEPLRDFRHDCPSRDDVVRVVTYCRVASICRGAGRATSR
jgi:hypothetical protein